jgi:adenosine deaminase
VAIEQLRAQRIGHATTILQDPLVVELALAHEVTLEACVTSNLQTGVIARVEDHPLRRWLDGGLKACVCVDNTLFSNITAPEELELVNRIPGMNPTLSRQVVDYGHQAAFKR